MKQELGAYSVQEHFDVVAEIWLAFFAKQISGKKREALLAPFRARLESEVPQPK